MAGDVGAAHPLEVHIYKSVGGGKQASRLRRRVLAQKNHRGDRGHKEQEAEQDRKVSPESHGGWRWSQMIAPSDSRRFLPPFTSPQRVPRPCPCVLCRDRAGLL